MLNHGSLFCVAALLIATFCVLGDARGNDDAKELLGTWDYVSVTYEGKPFDVGKDATITIEKDGWTIRRNGQTIQSTWTIDSTKSPKQLTQVVTRGKVSFSMKSIYRLDKDRLVVCEPDHPDKPRPEKFVARGGDGQFLIVLRRQNQRPYR